MKTNINRILDEILVFPDRFGNLLQQLDVSDRALALPRLKHLVTGALMQNPTDQRAAALRALYEDIAAQMA